MMEMTTLIPPVDLLFSHSVVSRYGSSSFCEAKMFAVHDQHDPIKNDTASPIECISNGCLFQRLFFWVDDENLSKVKHQRNIN